MIVRVCIYHESIYIVTAPDRCPRGWGHQPGCRWQKSLFRELPYDQLLSRPARSARDLAQTDFWDSYLTKDSLFLTVNCFIVFFMSLGSLPSLSKVSYLSRPLNNLFTSDSQFHEKSPSTCTSSYRRNCYKVLRILLETPKFCVQETWFFFSFFSIFRSY